MNGETITLSVKRPAEGKWVVCLDVDRDVARELAALPERDAHRMGDRVEGFIRNLVQERAAA